MNVGPLELLVVLVIVLLIFGPKRLPALGRQLGSGLREFKDSVTGRDGPDRDAPARPELTAAEADADRTARATDAADATAEPAEPRR